MSNKDHKGDIRSIQPEVLVGDPRAVAETASSLCTKKVYTSGVLSFTEVGLSSDFLRSISKRHQEITFPGFLDDRFASTYVCHRDKKIAESHYVYANVDLLTGKSLNPYLHKMDFFRISTWRKIINIVNELSSPSELSRKKLIVFNYNLPAEKKELIEKLSVYIAEQVLVGFIGTRDDVLEYLDELGFIIKNIRPKSCTVDMGDGVDFYLRGVFFDKHERFSNCIEKTLDGENRINVDEIYSELVKFTKQRAEKLAQRYGADCSPAGASKRAVRDLEAIRYPISRKKDDSLICENRGGPPAEPAGDQVSDNYVCDGDSVTDSAHCERILQLKREIKHFTQGEHCISNNHRSSESSTQKESSAPPISRKFSPT